MADPLATEKALSFTEPAIYPSRDFVTIQTVERPSQPGNFWGPGQRFTITIRSPGQNEFMDADKMRLEFSVLCVGDAPQQPLFDPEYIHGDDFTSCLATQASCNIYRNADTVGLPLSTKQDVLCNLPGMPSWGCPFFQSVRVSVPGLPLESLLTSDRESQWMVATRLMCSGGSPVMDEDAGPISFGISGEASAAGARSGILRAQAVSFGQVHSNRSRHTFISDERVDSEALDNVFQPGGVLGVTSIGASGTINPDHALRAGDWAIPDGTRQVPWAEGDIALRGTPQHYSVPLSLFSSLFCTPSNLIPLGFYSTSADTISFTFETAPASSALTNNGADRPDIAPVMTYYIIDPEIRYTKVQVSNPSVLASIEALFRGVASVPIAPGFNVSLNFVMKFLNYGQSQTRVNGPNGFFNLSIPCNQPSMRGIAIRFCGESAKNAGLYTGTVVKGFSTDPNFYNFGVMPEGANFNAAVFNGYAAASLELVSQFRFNLNNASETPTWQKYSAGDGQWGGRYLLSPRPKLRNVILRIASYRVPLDALLDITYRGTENPRGLLTNPFSVLKDQPGAQVLADLSLGVCQRAAHRLYKQGKHLFSPFATDEHPYDAPLADLYMCPSREDSAAGTLLQGYCLSRSDHISSLQSTIPSAFLIGDQVKVMCGGGGMREPAIMRQRYTHTESGGGTEVATAYSGWFRNTTGANRSRTPLPYWSGPNLLILPLESIGAVYNHRDDAFALRGLDLRSISSMELSGEIEGTQGPIGLGDPWCSLYGCFNGDINANAGGLGDNVQCQSWTVRAYSAYDHEHVLIPGRIDTEAQFSLIPTGATAIPSGGAPAF